MQNILNIIKIILLINNLPINIVFSTPTYSIFSVFDEKIALWLNSICFNNAAAAETANDLYYNRF